MSNVETQKWKYRSVHTLNNILGLSIISQFGLNVDLTSCIFKIWAIQLELELVPKEIQNPGRIYKHATIVGNRFSFQSIILMRAPYL